VGNLNYHKHTIADPKQVSDDCAKKLKIAAEGGGYWLAFGCEIPRELSVDNMKAIMRTLKTSGKYPIQ
jgi:uroporphyrinogen-III decarboxylase